MIKFYKAPIVQIELNGRHPFASKTMLYRQGQSRHTIVWRDDENTTCVARVDADESEHAAILADPEITETNDELL